MLFVNAASSERYREIFSMDYLEKALQKLEGYGLEIIANPTHSDPHKRWVVEASHPDEFKDGHPRYIGYGAYAGTALIAVSYKIPQNE